MKKNTTGPGKPLSKNHDDIDLEQIKRKYGYNEKARELIGYLEHYLTNRSNMNRIESNMVISTCGESVNGEQLEVRMYMRPKGFNFLRVEMLKMTETEITRIMKELSDIPDAKVIPISFARSLCHA